MAPANEMACAAVVPGRRAMAANETDADSWPRKDGDSERAALRMRARKEAQVVDSCLRLRGAGEQSAAEHET